MYFFCSVSTFYISDFQRWMFGLNWWCHVSPVVQAGTKVVHISIQVQWPYRQLTNCEIRHCYFALCPDSVIWATSMLLHDLKVSVCVCVLVTNVSIQKAFCTMWAFFSSTTHGLVKYQPSHLTKIIYKSKKNFQLRFKCPKGIFQLCKDLNYHTGANISYDWHN